MTELDKINARLSELDIKESKIRVERKALTKRREEIWDAEALAASLFPIGYEADLPYGYQWKKKKTRRYRLTKIRGFRYRATDSLSIEYIGTHIKQDGTLGEEGHDMTYHLLALVKAGKVETGESK